VRTKTVSQADKMLDAAARLFAAQRFHEVRMEDIASEAQVGKGTLYRYFSDKEELYLALLERAGHQVMERLTSAVEQAEGARSRLVAYVDAVLDYFDSQPHLFDLIQRAEVLRGSGPEFPWKHVRDASIQLIHDLFEQGKKQQEFCIRDPEMSALMLLGGLRGVLRFGNQPRERHVARKIVDGFLQGADTGLKSKSPVFHACEG
jgi:AcrR family transcriptional regulator